MLVADAGDMMLFADAGDMMLAADAGDMMLAADAGDMMLAGDAGDMMLAADAGDMMLLQLMASPQLLSTGVFVTVLRMLVIMCASCPDLAVMLLKQSTLSCFFIIVYNSAQIKWLTLGPLFLNFHVK